MSSFATCEFQTHSSDPFSSVQADFGCLGFPMNFSNFDLFRISAWISDLSFGFIRGSFSRAGLRLGNENAEAHPEGGYAFHRFERTQGDDFRTGAVVRVDD